MSSQPTCRLGDLGHGVPFLANDYPGVWSKNALTWPVGISGIVVTFHVCNRQGDSMMQMLLHPETLVLPNA
jgi:hypothetical protein